VIDVAGDAVHHTADRDADPQRTTAMPAAQVAAGTAGQRRQRLGLPTARGGGFDGVEGPTEQVGGHDARGARADVDAEGEERLGGGGSAAGAVEPRR
jgi:hypothetical protein